MAGQLGNQGFQCPASQAPWCPRWPSRPITQLPNCRVAQLPNRPIAPPSARSPLPFWCRSRIRVENILQELLCPRSIRFIVTRYRNTGWPGPGFPMHTRPFPSWRLANPGRTRNSYASCSAVRVAWFDSNSHAKPHYSRRESVNCADHIGIWSFPR